MRENNRRSLAFAAATVLATALTLTLTHPAPSSAETGRTQQAAAAQDRTGRWSGSLDTLDQDAVNKAYWSKYAPQDNKLVEWLGGSLLSCLPGLTSSLTNAGTLSALNYARSLAGLAPVKFSPTMNADAQKAALIMAANNSLSHTPSRSWKCWTQTGATTAGKSNLVLAFPSLKAGQIIDSYLDDKGLDNVAAGHRRWILNPYSTVMGSGSTATANALTVIGPTNQYRPSPTWVGWPTAGYFPNPLEPAGRWSLSAGSQAVSFAHAKVFVYRSDGKQMHVHQYAVHTGYGQPTIVWRMPSGFSRKATYKVGVTGIKKSGVKRSLRTSYTVRLFTPSR